MHTVPLQKAVGTRIYELRRRAGLEVAQLAEKSGLSHNRILAIENGKVNLNLGTMLILAMSLDATLLELFSGIADRFGIYPKSAKGRVIVIPRYGKLSKSTLRGINV